MRIDNHFCECPTSNQAHLALRRWLGVIGFTGGGCGDEPVLRATNLQRGPTCGAVASRVCALLARLASEQGDSGWLTADTTSATGKAAMTFAYEKYTTPERWRDGRRVENSRKLDQRAYMTRSEVRNLCVATLVHETGCSEEDARQHERERHECLAFDDACHTVLLRLAEAYEHGSGGAGLRHITLNTSSSNGSGYHWFTLSYELKW